MSPVLFGLQQKVQWFCLISYFSKDLIWFLFLSSHLSSLPPFSWPVNWSAVFGKTTLKHINPVYFFAFSLCCQCISIWDWDRTDHWRFPLVLCLSPSFLTMMSIRPAHFDFSPIETRTWGSWCVCNSHPHIESGCSWGVWSQVQEPEISRRVHSSDIAWDALNRGLNRRSCCQEAARPPVIVVPWFGFPLCYCTVVIFSLRTSHVN